MSDIVIIGAGNMGMALAKGLLRNTDNHVYFKVKSQHQTHDFQSKQIIYSDDFNDFAHLKQPFVFCAVKPNMMIDVIKNAKEYFNAVNPVAIISVAAGIQYKNLCQAVSNNIPVIRSMPNTPISYGKGIVGFYGQHHDANEQFKKLCQPLGYITELADELEFNLFTAFAGSGPAFVFHFTEALALAAEKLGMEKNQANLIATKLIHGSAHMLEEDNAESLRKKVTSPNGTTYAGLQNLINQALDTHNSHLSNLLYQTLEAAKKRSENMA